jgi:class 3 adenylate cyclase
VDTNFRDQLKNAEGKSRHVVVIFLDVRGFSSFAGIAESTDTAEFLKSVYLRILDHYFVEPDFFKPTGDGLLLIYGYSRETLTEAVRSAVDRSLKLIEDFPTICDDDPMINFEVPRRLGIGLSRGSATALADGEVMLDFSGRPLNLASRLMDLARPSGVVFDESFGAELLEDPIGDRFTEDEAYIKGIAESEPLHVYCLKGYTEIPEFNRRPMDNLQRVSEKTETIAFKEFCERAPVFRHNISQEPARFDNIEILVEYPAVRSNGTKHPSMLKVGKMKAEFGRTASVMYVSADYTEYAQNLKAVGVKSKWGVRLTVEYSVPRQSAETLDPAPIVGGSEK